ncbi:MAG: hypothetical protein AAFO06_05445 [Cyanobacteria bacterium J06597_16]
MRFFSLSRYVLSRYVPLLLVATLASCNLVPPASDPSPQPSEAQGDVSNEEVNAVDEDAKETTKSPELADKPTAKPAPTPVMPAIAPGKYCYESSDENQDIQVRLVIATNDQVSGIVQGAIHNDKESYYTSYHRAVNGTIDGSNLNVDVVTWIEYDKQNKQETWRVSPTALTVDKDTLSKASCEAVDKAFENYVDTGDEALSTYANKGQIQEIFFKAGNSGTTVSNAVIRGDRDIYTLIAQGGQQMALSITSLEDNAVFDVVGPTGFVLSDEQTEGNIFLPHTGEYTIIVGGTRGNASYDLSVAIE